MAMQFFYTLRFRLIANKGANEEIEYFHLENGGSMILKRNGDPEVFFSEDQAINHVRKIVGKYNSKYMQKIKADVELVNGQVTTLMNLAPPREEQ